MGVCILFIFIFSISFLNDLKKKIRTEPRVNLGGSVLHTKCVHSIKLGGLGVCFERKSYKSREFGDIFWAPIAFQRYRKPSGYGGEDSQSLKKKYWGPAISNIPYVY